MGKLTANQREIIGANCISAMNNGRRVRVYCSTKEGGEQVAGAINAAYGYKCTKSENIFETVTSHVILAVAGPAGTGAGMLMENWKNFSCDAKTKSKAQKLTKEINECIADYGGAAGYEYTGTEDPGTSGGSRLGKTAIYLIIGAVLAVLVAIIIKRKKK